MFVVVIDWLWNRQVVRAWLQLPIGGSHLVSSVRNHVFFEKCNADAEQL